MICALDTKARHRGGECRDRRALTLAVGSRLTAAAAAAAERDAVSRCATQLRR